jgi:hypothetical protein
MAQGPEVRLIEQGEMTRRRGETARRRILSVVPPEADPLSVAKRLKKT